MWDAPPRSKAMPLRCSTARSVPVVVFRPGFPAANDRVRTGARRGDRREWQAVTSLSFIEAGHAAPTAHTVALLDAACEATLVSNHVGKRASIAQGKGFLAAVLAAYAELGPLAKEIKGMSHVHGHLAPLIGVFCSKLNLSLHQTSQMFLFVTLRSLISAAVRLSICGPMQGQRIQADVLAACVPALLATRNTGISTDAPDADGHVDADGQGGDSIGSSQDEQDASAVWGSEWGTREDALSRRVQAQSFITSPIVDILQGTHDRLFCRLFSS